MKYRVEARLTLRGTFTVEAGTQKQAEEIIFSHYEGMAKNDRSILSENKAVPNFEVGIVKEIVKTEAIA